MKDVIVFCMSAFSTAPWYVIMLRAAIISQTQQKGSVGFLENDVKLFCMLLFARCLLWCQGSGVIGGNLLSAWNLCLNVYAAAAQYHWDHHWSRKLGICWSARGVTFISTDEAESGLMSHVIRVIKSQENMCHCPVYFFKSPTHSDDDRRLIIFYRQSHKIQ